MLVKQLVAAKSAVKSAEEGIDAALLYLIDQVPGVDGGECKHPEDNRQVFAAMGADKPAWLCKLCGYVEGGDLDGN